MHYCFTTPRPDVPAIHALAMQSATTVWILALDARMSTVGVGE